MVAPSIPFLEVPPIDIGPLKSAASDAIEEIVRALQAAHLVPHASIEIPRMANLSLATRRAWATTFINLARNMDPSRDMREQLERFRAFQDDWDEEGAPAPSSDAIQRAASVIDWADSHEVVVADLDVDVLGGVAVYLGADADRHAWIACMNSGSTTVVLSETDQVVGHFMSDPDHLDRVLAFLRGEDVEGR